MNKGILIVMLAALPALGSMQAGGQERPAAAPAQESAAKPAAGTEADAAKPAAPPQGMPGVDEKTFVIGAEDQIHVEVWGDPRIGGGPVLVRPDGRISLTLLGDIMAAGRTPLELASDIAEQLKQKDVLRRPQVSVRVLQVLSKKYSINGEVMKTGSFPLVVPTRVMDALVNAGGFKDFANKKEIVIIRGQERLKFNWNDVVRGKKTDQNVFLQHGDIIIVK
jgi:polysaccharide export outer membrane protein